MGSPSGSYGEIVNDSGRPAFYVKAAFPILDLKVHPNGDYSYFSSDAGGFTVLDSKFTKITNVKTVGFPTDNHDFMILPNGHYLLFGYDSLFNYDISGIVGQPKVVSAIGVVIQELDQDQKVVWQWRGWDEGNFVPEDMQHPETVAGTIMDATHSNSIDVDADGNILLSSRHLSEVTKIDRKTGQIIWRMGGKKNQFTFVNDTLGFSYQHSARYLPPSAPGEPYHLLLLDNGNYHPQPFSRAVEYAVDEKAMTATLVWQYDHDRSVFAQFMGNVQRLPNGNTMIGWGGSKTPSATEVHPDGSIAYEATISGNSVSYRVFRFPTTNSSVASRPELGFAVSALAPNPAVSLSTFAVTSEAPRTLTIGVYDVTGRLIESVFSGRIENGVSLYQLHADKWPHGSYQVVVQSDQGSVVRSFIH
jgi:hypothetical protein